MSVVSRANLNRTVLYLRRNGVRETWYAAREALEERKREPYRYEPPDREELARQREWADGRILEPGRPGEQPELPPQFSILVPAYRTGPEYLRAMIVSALRQSYRYFELILADASGDDSVYRIYEGLRARAREGAGFDRIRYVRLPENGGISANTNAALELATGDYIALLDHDDLLAPDALYHFARAILERKVRERPLLLYSDEDKCDAAAKRFYEPNRKPDFNGDLLLSNNYICHLLAIERNLARGLRLRSAYDGAQDYDLALRAWRELHRKAGGGALPIVHIPRVLYHWRCYGGSTAENPASKRYAYEAGRRAIGDFVRSEGWNAEVRELRHVGFYEVRYTGNPFRDRPGLGAVGGRVVERRLAGTARMIGGAMDAEGRLLYGGLAEGFGGYLHRAVLTQDVEALDVRCLRLRKELQPLYEEVTGVPYGGKFPAQRDWKRPSLALSRALRERGYFLLYYPRWVTYY